MGTTTGAERRVSALRDVFAWFSDPATWTGYAGIPTRVTEHLLLSGTALALALPVAVGAGLFIGHTRRAEFVTVSLANLGRAVPSFAILALAFPISLRLGLGLGFWPTVVALFFLAIPPILTNTYVGVKGVDADAVEAARGMGLSGTQVLRSLEIPLAAPLIVAGVRTSAVQVVATATLAAVIAGGGLGRFIVDGFAFGVRGIEGRQMVMGGAILVALLALATEVAFGLLERRVGPRQVTVRAGRDDPVRLGPPLARDDATR
ncbi:MAG TPA: ABC transporter permease [Actinomycetota bacterium]|nr:ABC transporter permease [Actinomycetota bacterium]